MTPESLIKEPYDISILGVSESGARSRTETQVKLILRILPKCDSPAVKWICLPSTQMSNGRQPRSSRMDTLSSSSSSSSPEECTLRIRARVVRSDIDQPVYSCYSCILRERRRGLKKRSKLEESEAMSGEAELNEIEMNTIDMETEQDRERILVFASQNEKLQVLRSDVMIPIRLTCYCRHHDEKVGFRVKLELWNNLNRNVGFAYSPPIMITDDHKRSTRQTKIDTANGREGLRQEALLYPMIPMVRPRVLKVVPSDGPMYGGIEVTVIGEYLLPDGIVLFGQLPAPIITYINVNSVIVRLPPSQTAGIVPVIVSGQDTLNNGPGDFAFFNYKNDIDRAMMELALQLIGMKMTGKVDDARDVALRIISEFSPISPHKTEGHTGNNEACLRQHDNLRVGSNVVQVPSEHLERVLITCFAAAEVTGGLALNEDDVLDIRTVGGQTLLHLAALSRYDHLFDYLGGLGTGKLLSAVDNNGFTPSDLYYLVGGQDVLENLGLDDSDTDDLGLTLDLKHRYELLLRRVQQRSKSHAGSIWALVSDGINRIRRRPSVIKNHFNRLKRSLWRRVTSEAVVKEYYLKSFGLPSIINFGAGTRLIQEYQESKPFKRRHRDFMFLYFWIPILVAALFVWFFDLGPSVFRSSVSTITPSPTQLFV